ncbi:MAG: ADP-ribosylglycohydrolase family protein [Ruminococcaceae bacterium]|nr:ADP-ribosylglycohydrolase family protein [Oscillospiraceae bacterium]
MKLNFDTYKDKVYACWIGKNVGGTMGTPYEGKREVLDVKGFATAPGEPLPNDDLDLQLVWLHAMENEGPYALDCKKLGEYWLTLVSPFWNEYGIGKTNMRHGLLPPLSGDYENTWKHSNGAWIRTEIWASMAPGCPQIAAKYAIEDACVDHGAGEGTFAAAFVAAMQATAFVIPNIRKCIDVALSAIPADCRVGNTVRKVLSCYDNGVSWLDCRNTVLEMNADIGTGWFEAPSNVGYTVLGLVYGEGDFKKSMISAINCGDDTDCTAATVGATLGILGGSAAIPQDWKEYIGDRIITMSVAEGIIRNLPDTCTALTERVVKMAPIVLRANGAKVELTAGESESDGCELPTADTVSDIRKRLCALKPYQFEIDAGIFKVRVTYDRAPDIAPGEELGVTLSLLHPMQARERRNFGDFGNVPYSLNLRWWLPDGFTVEGKKSVFLYHNTSRDGYPGRVPFHDIRCVIRAGETVEAVNRLVLEVTADGRPTAAYVPLVLMG